jgi:hypothetical protein
VQFLQTYRVGDLYENNKLKAEDASLRFFSVIETDYNFGSGSAFYVSLGANLDQTRLYLGVYGSMNVTDFNQGTVFEIVP